jgi:hypothetical protein
MATSQLKQAIKDLKAQILTVPEFLYTAVFNNQVRMEDKGLTFDFPKPAVLIELEKPSKGLQTLGGYATVNEFIWKFYIVHEQLDAENDGTISSGMDENLDIYDLRDALKTALTGFKPTNCSMLQYDDESPDYEHNNIYVYCLSMKCSFVDTKGSPLDGDSTQWITGSLTDMNLNVFLPWESGKSYVENGNAVIQAGLIYLCTTSNNDDTFTIGNWKLIPSWEPGGPYTATTSYVAYQNGIYQCSTNNTDTTFILSNWTKIV